VALPEPPPLQEGVEGLGQVVRPEEGPELPGGEEVGEEGEPRVGTDSARERRRSNKLIRVKNLIAYRKTWSLTKVS